MMLIALSGGALLALRWPTARVLVALATGSVMALET
jgi:hypothetical protein